MHSCFCDWKPLFLFLSILLYLHFWETVKKWKPITLGGWEKQSTFAPDLASKKSVLLYFKCISIFSSTGIILVCIIVYIHIVYALHSAFKLLYSVLNAKTTEATDTTVSCFFLFHESRSWWKHFFMAPFLIKVVMIKCSLCQVLESGSFPILIY